MTKSKLDSSYGAFPRAWSSTVGPAILDEAQKEPSLFEKIKFAYDEKEINFSVLLGSSQIEFLAKINESLAGRVFIYHLWPLMLCELTNSANHQNIVNPPLFAQLIQTDQMADAFFHQFSTVLLKEDAYERARWLDYLLKWGGMPELPSFDEPDRQRWLHSYTNTYLERDLSDVGHIRDLLPFRRFLRLTAHRSGHVISDTDLARDADISPSTAKNYLDYMNLLHQTYLLEPYYFDKCTVKAPKLYWTDLGLWRHQTNYWGEPTGQLIETFVVGECKKWIQTTGSRSELWFYRSHSGLEVDLLITTPAGMWGIEIKSSSKVKRSQASSLRRVASQLNVPWQGGIVAYMGNQIQQMDDNIWAVPIARLFSA